MHRPLPAAVLVIGCGRMGRALLECWADYLPCFAYDRHTSHPKGVVGLMQLAEVSNLPSPLAVVIAVKPQHVMSVLDTIGSLITSGTTVISVAAGASIERMRSALPRTVTIARAMPNLACASGNGTSAICCEERSSAHIAVALFEKCGGTCLVDEGLMGQATVVSGSGPAYFLLLTEDLVAAAKASGLSETEAAFLARGALIAAGAMASKRDIDLQELRDSVTSPGGTTEAALEVLSTSGLQRILTKALAAGLARCKELATS